MEAGTDTSQWSAGRSKAHPGEQGVCSRECSLSKVQPHLLLVLGDAGLGSLDVLSSALGLERAEDVGRVVMTKTLTHSEPAHGPPPYFQLVLKSVTVTLGNWWNLQQTPNSQNLPCAGIPLLRKPGMCEGRAVPWLCAGAHPEHPLPLTPPHPHRRQGQPQQ